jgi:type VI secretion system protein ImpA
MANTDFDLEILLAPISEGAPAGTDPAGDLLFGQIKEARTQALRDEQGLGEAGDAWRQVRSGARSLLSNKAKDLRVARWLTEAWLRSDGLAGLAAGATLLTGLMERYWDGLFPRPDEYGISTRFIAFSKLDEFAAPLNLLTLFQMPDGTPVSIETYQKSAAFDGLTDQREKSEWTKAGFNIPVAARQAAARAVPPAQFQALMETLTKAEAAWAALDEALLRLGGPVNAPRTRDVSAPLAAIRDIIAPFAPAVPALELSPMPDTPIDVQAAPAAAPAGRGPLNSREDAMTALLEIAAFFRRTEPHSPLADTLETAVRRGRMAWPELLKEITDQKTREGILLALGIKTE